jgi:hypothetical protein
MNGKSKAWALALLVAVLLLGGVAGAAVDRILVGNRSVSSGQRGRSGDRDDRGRRGSYLDWLSARLELSDEQRSEVQGILERHREQVSGLWSEMRPRYEELQQQARAEIRGVLTDQQAAAYDALLQKQRERHERDDRRHGNGDRGETEKS